MSGWRVLHLGESDPALVREAVAREPGTAVLAIGAARGEAFTPSPWERRWLERSDAA